MSKLLGKETIDATTFGQSKGRSGSYSITGQILGRELMTPDEVRMLDNRYALLFIRGERPVKDEKYDILKHPNIALTTDGGAKPFVHGEDTRSIASIQFIPNPAKGLGNVYEGDYSIQLLTDEELEYKLKEKETKSK